MFFENELYNLILLCTLLVVFGPPLFGIIVLLVGGAGATLVTVLIMPVKWLYRVIRRYQYFRGQKRG